VIHPEETVKFIQALVLLALTTTALGAFPGTSSTAPEKIEVVAKRFTFEPAEITVHKGQPVTLDISTEDVAHGLAINELGIRTEVKKGKASEVSFTPEQVGTFVGKCAHFCGAGHGAMTLTINVTE
jgi:cytochrome c oxidase subunit 2